MSYVEKIISDVENFTSDMFFALASLCTPQSCINCGVLAQNVANHVMTMGMGASLLFGGFAFKTYQFCDATSCFS